MPLSFEMLTKARKMGIKVVKKNIYVRLLLNAKDECVQTSKQHNSLTPNTFEEFQ